MEEEHSRRRTLAGHEDAGGGVGRSLGPLRDLEVAPAQPPARRELNKCVAAIGDDRATTMRADVLWLVCNRRTTHRMINGGGLGLVLRGDRWTLGGKENAGVTGRERNTIDVERLRLVTTDGHTRVCVCVSLTDGLVARFRFLSP